MENGRSVVRNRRNRIPSGPLTGIDSWITIPIVI